MQVSCAVRNYWQQTPAIITGFVHSDTSYFVGLRVESVSYLITLFRCSDFSVDSYYADCKDFDAFAAEDAISRVICFLGSEKIKVHT